MPSNADLDSTIGYEEGEKNPSNPTEQQPENSSINADGKDEKKGEEVSKSKHESSCSKDEDGEGNLKRNERRRKGKPATKLGDEEDEPEKKKEEAKTKKRKADGNVFCEIMETFLIWSPKFDL